MFDRLLLANFATTDLPEELWTRLNECAGSVVHTDRDSETFIEDVSTADGLILRLGMHADRALIDAAPNLRYIGMFGTGYGNIDAAYARERGIAVTNVADYSTESVAEFVVGCALIHLRNLCDEHSRAQQGDVAETSFIGRELSSLTVGIAGAGHIGSRTIELMAAGFGAATKYWSRHRRPNLEEHPNVAFAELDELLSTSDLVSLHLAKNDDTVNLIDSTAVGRLKNGAILINTAPNEILDLDAVLARCSAGELTFVMDHADELVEAEDYERVRTTSNVYVYPPIGYATTQASQLKCEVLVSNIEQFLNGAPTNHVNP